MQQAQVLVYVVCFRTEILLDMAEDLLAVVVVLIEPRHDLSRSHQIHRSKGFTHGPLQPDREKIMCSDTDPRGRH